MAHAKSFQEISHLPSEEPGAVALYRFTELFGFHDDKCSFRQFLRGREKIRKPGAENQLRGHARGGHGSRPPRGPSPMSRGGDRFGSAHSQQQPQRAPLTKEELRKEYELQRQGRADARKKREIQNKTRYDKEGRRHANEGYAAGTHDHYGYKYANDGDAEEGYIDGGGYGADA